jgi:integrase
MTALAPALQAYFTDRLIAQRAASPNTIGAYKLTFRLLLTFASKRLGKTPAALDIAEPRHKHDLRHTFAVLQLSAGIHFIQVSKWLGHRTFTLTLDVHGDYISEEDGGALNTLPEPPALASAPVEAGGKVMEAVSSRLLRSSFLAILAGCAKALES